MVIARQAGREYPQLVAGDRPVGMITSSTSGIGVDSGGANGTWQGITVPIGTVPDRPVAVRTISGGPFAVCHFEVDSDSFQQAWEDAFAWLVDGGYECDDKPCYELYQQSAADHPEGKCVFDICIPLKREN
jgi:effector-binding domain-containing protein